MERAGVAFTNENGGRRGPGFCSVVRWRRFRPRNHQRKIVRSIVFKLEQFRKFSQGKPAEQKGCYQRKTEPAASWLYKNSHVELIPRTRPQLNPLCAMAVELNVAPACRRDGAFSLASFNGTTWPPSKLVPKGWHYNQLTVSRKSARTRPSYIERCPQPRCRAQTQQSQPC
jgi:hypothetical protein